MSYHVYFYLVNVCISSLSLSIFLSVSFIGSKALASKFLQHPRYKKLFWLWSVVCGTTIIIIMTKMLQSEWFRNARLREIECVVPSREMSTYQSVWPDGYFTFQSLIIYNNNDSLPRSIKMTKLVQKFPKN